MSKLLLDLAEELDAEEDVFVSLLLLDLASEEEGFTEELDSLAFSTEELDFSSFLEEEEETSLPSLEEEMTEDEESSDGSGETEEEESSPHATRLKSAVKRTPKPNKRIFISNPIVA